MVSGVNFADFTIFTLEKGENKLIISVLQNQSRSFSPFSSPAFSDFTHENTGNRCFLPGFYQTNQIQKR